MPSARLCQELQVQSLGNRYKSLVAAGWQRGNLLEKAKNIYGPKGPLRCWGVSMSENKARWI